MALTVHIPPAKGLPATTRTYHSIDNISPLAFDGPMRARMLDLVFMDEGEFNRFTNEFKYECDHDIIDGEYHVMNFIVRKSYKIVFFRTSNIS